MVNGQNIIFFVKTSVAWICKGFCPKFSPVVFKQLIYNSILTIHSIVSGIGSFLDWILISYQGKGVNYSFPDDFFPDDNG